MKQYKLKVELIKHPDGSLTTLSVWDERTQKYWKSKQISERGIGRFLNVEDCKQTLNWNLHGDSAKYRMQQRDNIVFALIYPCDLNKFRVSMYLNQKGHDNACAIIDHLHSLVSDPVKLIETILKIFPDTTEEELLPFID